MGSHLVRNRPSAALVKTRCCCRCTVLALEQLPA